MPLEEGGGMENKMNLEIKNVSYRYREDGRQILENFSLTVSQKERVGLAAPSGYGKTTLCKLLSGYLKPDQGKSFWMESRWLLTADTVRYR